MSSRRRRAAAVATLFACAVAAPVAAPVAAQVVPVPPTVPPPMERIELSGPRFGVTMLGGSIVDSLSAHGAQVGRVITQFGWQFERQFYAIEGGP
ncbi:MAG TPA: hypothetical protein VFV33_27510, partial [Gemmatimonadaceae bacterium]|nr:hypothetical protein [Gemmatimonadaceae bacterium]